MHPLILKMIETKVLKNPDAPCIVGQDPRTYLDFWNEIQSWAHFLKKNQCTRVGIFLENSSAWLALDLACLQERVVVVPLPPFFSDQQLDHMIKNAGIGHVFCDQIKMFYSLFDQSNRIPFSQQITCFERVVPLQEVQTLPKGTVKITFTSGSTGTPKGVCLGHKESEVLLQSLEQILNLSQPLVHICVAPLSLLLENICGAYLTLYLGGAICVSKESSLECLMAEMKEKKVTTCIISPEILKGMIASVKQGEALPSSLSFIGVGGTKVPKDLLLEAHAYKIPVYEGYGLSEMGSICTLNTPASMRIGSVGKPLSHIKVKIADDGEVLLKGAPSLGYMTESLSIKADGYYPSGDLGYMEEGYLYVNGRKKNVFINSYGRNFSPEWIESILLSSPYIYQAVIYGDSCPFNTALIVPMPNVGLKRIEADIQRFNSTLPEHAQVQKIIICKEPFSVANGQLTGTGYVKRDVIYDRCFGGIRTFY